ncbi:MAG: hypothetical protein QXW77_03775 [Candidatus Hadarchaeales archaeon]
MRRKYWIQEAIRKPGALRSYVLRKYGKRGFTNGIRVSILRRLAKKKGKVGRRARLALTLRRLRRRRR